MYERKFKKGDKVVCVKDSIVSVTFNLDKSKVFTVEYESADMILLKEDGRSFMKDRFVLWTPNASTAMARVLIDKDEAPFERFLNST